MKDIGQKMHAFIAQLYPICRSITGDGVRETLKLVREKIPIELHEVPTGTKVLDWTVPKEWNIRDAWIKNAAGERLVDFRQLNLHVVSYSVPVRKRMSFVDLKEHLFTLEGEPELVPYRTSYYEERWGFCLSQNQLAKFQTGEEYEVCIESSLEPGHLTYAEYYLEGETREEVLISCHICHPSLANDNLSGIALAVELARSLANTPRRYSYRFLFIPGTIGSITWLAQNEERVPAIRHGLVLTNVGDMAPVTYKKSRRGDAEIDRAFAHLLRQAGEPDQVIDFYPYGYDERQYCSPGFNLAVGTMMRSRHGTFREYHTSADNLSFVRPDALADSFTKAAAVLEILEHNRVYLNLHPKGEPQLGRRGLYEGLGAGASRREQEMALLWTLNLSDGEHSLLAIAERAELPFAAIRAAAESLVAAELLREK